MPASIPQHLWDMRREENRWQSFHLPDASFTAAHLVSVTDLAADGFFYLQESDRVKCAFCKGVLKDWEAGEQVREAHRRHFSTCPFVLFVEVGNVPRDTESQKDDQTADDAAVMVNGDWSMKLVAELPPMEFAGLNEWALATRATIGTNAERVVDDELVAFDMMKRPQLPVSSEVARSACSERALTNLSALQHSLESDPSSVTAKHAQFETYQARSQSLHSALVQQPVYLLAKAGFFYSEAERATCCFSCGLCMSEWSCDDDVWVEHARWSPRCPHVLLERGSDFVQAVHRLSPPVQHPTCGASAQRHTALVQTDSTASAGAATVDGSRADEALAVTPGVEFRVEARDIKARADLPVVRLLTQLGFSALQVRLFTELHLRQRGDDFATSELFLDFMLTESRRMRKQSQDPEAFFESRIVSEPTAETRDTTDWKTCKVCMDKEVNIMLLDCGHVACCSVCAKSLKTCPICRAFYSRLPIFSTGWLVGIRWAANKIGRAWSPRILDCVMERLHTHGFKALADCLSQLHGYAAPGDTAFPNVDCCPASERRPSPSFPENPRIPKVIFHGGSKMNWHLRSRQTPTLVIADQNVEFVKPASQDLDSRERESATSRIIIWAGYNDLRRQSFDLSVARLWKASFTNLRKAFPNAEIWAVQVDCTPDASDATASAWTGSRPLTLNEQRLFERGQSFVRLRPAARGFGSSGLQASTGDRPETQAMLQELQELDGIRDDIKDCRNAPNISDAEAKALWDLHSFRNVKRMMKNHAQVFLLTRCHLLKVPTASGHLRSLAGLPPELHLQRHDVELAEQPLACLHEQVLTRLDVRLNDHILGADVRSELVRSDGHHGNRVLGYVGDLPHPISRPVGAASDVAAKVVGTVADPLEHHVVADEAPEELPLVIKQPDQRANVRIDGHHGISELSGLQAVGAKAASVVEERHRVGWRLLTQRLLQAPAQLAQWKFAAHFQVGWRLLTQRLLQAPAQLAQWKFAAHFQVGWRLLTQRLLQAPAQLAQWKFAAHFQVGWRLLTQRLLQAPAQLAQWKFAAHFQVGWRLLTQRLLQAPAQLAQWKFAAHFQVGWRLLTQRLLQAPAQLAQWKFAAHFQVGWRLLTQRLLQAPAQLAQWKFAAHFQVGWRLLTQRLLQAPAQLAQWKFAAHFQAKRVDINVSRVTEQSELLLTDEVNRRTWNLADS
uniref:RING-type domain-containing protein n=1 Tax=Macrostomum lignano TaxID=282301 RepID=A0A1I8HGD9_9PLAT